MSALGSSDILVTSVYGKDLLIEAIYALSLIVLGLFRNKDWSRSFEAAFAVLVEEICPLISGSV